MATDPASIRSWQQQADPGRAPSPAGPRWRRGAVLSAQAPGHTLRTAGVALVLVLFCGLSGLLIWGITWLRPPRPACLVLLGAGYEDNLAIPPNVYGRETLRGLADITRDIPGSSHKGLLRLTGGEPQELRTDSPWDRGLRGLERAPENTIVLYLAVHGGTDPKGAYLLPQDADTRDDDANRLRLTQVLGRLEELPARKNKVLILDTTQLMANWPLGMLHNDFARELHAQEGRITSIPNLLVLCASDVDQRSWVSEEWRQTCFGHYVIEGLKGAADLNKDGRVNLLELSKYVSSRVEHWAQADRAALQTPFLLPRGEAAEKLAQSITLTFVDHKYVEPDPNSLPTFESPPELLASWETFERLQNQKPSPAVHTQFLWRQYQAVLLRYEQLLRAGDTGTAAIQANRLHDLERDLAAGQRLDLRSVQNTLAMPAAAGMTMAEIEPEFQRQFNELWDAPREEDARRWQTWSATVTDNIAKQLFRLKFFSLLLERAEKDPATNLGKAYALLLLAEDRTHPRPAEMHFLAMLNRDLPHDSPPRDLYEVLPLALQVRQLAEKATLGVRPGLYPYSEQVYPWIAGAVREGDKQRQLGQDLLFSTKSEDWEKARALLTGAREIYLKVQDRADIVRSALEVRDQVQDRLPAYSHWLADRRRSNDPQRRKEEAALFRNTLDLWKAVHQLISSLGNPDFDTSRQAPLPDVDAPQPRILARQTETVERAFRELERRFAEYGHNLQHVKTHEEADLPSIWRDTEEALLVPYQDAGLRMKLLDSHRQLSRRLVVEALPATYTAQPITTEDQRDAAKEQARRQGLMALAMLGTTWFDRWAENDWENTLKVQQRLETFAGEEKGWESLTQAGEQIGFRFRQMPIEINQLVNNNPPAELGKLHSAFREADHIARAMPGELNLVSRRDPNRDYRWLLLNDLLLEQAQRTLEDHWYAEDPTAEPYYRLAGKLFVTDSLPPENRLRDLQEPLKQAAAGVNRKLDLPGELVLVDAAGPKTTVTASPASSSVPPIAVTSEQSFAVPYRLVPARNAVVPGGHPVVWAVAGKSLQLLNAADGRRLVQEVNSADPVECWLTSPVIAEAEAKPPALPRREQTALALHGLFRGQVIDRPVRIDLYPRADTVVRSQMAPDSANLAVRAPRETQRLGTGDGGVAIVLDCSGSMGPATGQAFSESRLFQATQIIKGVLQRLPRDTTVSVWIFGEAMGPEKTATDAERTVRRVLDPVAWDPDDPVQLKGLLDKLAYPTEVEPWNESPLIRTILRAREDLWNVRGYKAVLVLSDGLDNRFDQDKEFNPDKKDIATALREHFNGGQIALHLVDFNKPQSPEDAKARETFKIIESLPEPGKVYTVAEGQELALMLETAMRQRIHYWIDELDSLASVLEIPPRGLDVSPAGANYQWLPSGMVPGQYKVRVNEPTRVEKNALLHGGDLLLVNLAATAQGLEFQRFLYSRDFPWKPAQETPNWRLAVMQNQLTDKGGLQMLVTLEKVPGKAETVLEQIRPQETWIELTTPTEVATPFALDWNSTWGFPAPAWTLDVPAWPTNPAAQTPARPVLHAWWNPEDRGPYAADLELRPLLNRTNVRVPVNGGEVVIESVQVEKHLVVTRPGVTEQKSCLVVRLHYPGDEPVIAQIHGLNLLGQEQRLYSEAGKYTGLFWPVEEGAAQPAVTRLRLVALSAFKKAARDRNCTMEIRDLKPPDAGDIRPLPVPLK